MLILENAKLKKCDEKNDVNPINLSMFVILFFQHYILEFGLLTRSRGKNDLHTPLFLY